MDIFLKTKQKKNLAYCSSHTLANLWQTMRPSNLAACLGHGLNDNGICRFKDLHFKYEITPTKAVDSPEAMLVELSSEGGESVDDV